MKSNTRRLSYSEIQRELGASELSAMPPLRFALLRNVVVDPIEPYLRYHAFRMGFNAQCDFGAYDNVFQDAVGGQSGILDERTDCVVVFLKLEHLSWALAREFASLDVRRIEEESARARQFITNVLNGIRAQTKALIVWNSLELPVHPSLGVLDYQQPNGQTAILNQLNLFLRDALRVHQDAYLLDVNACLARVGAGAFYDQRYWHIGRAPYSLVALEELSNEIFKYVRSAKGKNKKCLVLDCDNVLWGGVIGEDGLAGIKLGRAYPGSAYHELQQEIINLHHRGVVLALCSRNNEIDVWEVFKRHPEMLLRREHIATAQINWNNKVSNLVRIAEDLNLGLDSLVFIDDSPFEVDQVRQCLPQVEVIHLPKDRAVDYCEILATGGWFDTLTLSKEDRLRGVMYQAEAARKELQAKSLDLKSFYSSLEMTLEIRNANQFTIPRVAQLCRKTNQFSLTTRRYTDAEIHAFAASDESEVIHVEMRDRFGESGIVGVCILKYRDDRVLIDSFLLSCRVLGRGVEDAFLVQCLTRAKRRGSTIAVGEYRPTSKNGQVREFYSNHAFLRIPGDLDVQCFELDLATFDGRQPHHFRLIDAHFSDDNLARAVR